MFIKAKQRKLQNCKFSFFFYFAWDSLKVLNLIPVIRSNTQWTSLHINGYKNVLYSVLLAGVKVVLKNFTKFTGKHLCWSFFFNNVADWPLTLLKKRLQHRCFPANFVKFLRTPFFTEHLLRLLLSGNIHTYMPREEFNVELCYNYGTKNLISFFKKFSKDGLPPQKNTEMWYLLCHSLKSGFSFWALNKGCSYIKNVLKYFFFL